MPSGRPVAFGIFELDPASGELRKSGRRVHLQEQPLAILAALVERPGSIVSRDELRERLWAGDTFVDFDHGLNVAIAKLREALGDSASQPRYVETVPRKGYRFIGEIRGSAEVPVQRRPVRWRAAAAVSAVAVLGLGVALFVTRSGREVTLNAVPVTSEPGQEQEPSLSPDGAHVAYVSDPEGQLRYDIWVRSLGVGNPRRVTATPESERNPAWSPDGRLLAFVRHDGQDNAQVVLVPALGGAERVVTTVAMSGGTFARLHRLLAWFPDGKRLAVVSDQASRPAIQVLTLATGERKPLLAGGADADVDPAVSPSGDQVAFARLTRTGARLMIARPSGTAVPLTSGDRLDSFPAWTADGGEIVYASGAVHFRQLYRIPAGGGTPRQVPVSGGFHSAWPTMAAGRLVYHTGHYDVNLWRTPLRSLRAAGPAERIAASTYIDHMPALSPDAARLAFVSNRSGSPELWLAGKGGEDPQQVTSFGGGEVSRPLWSPDSRYVAFSVAGASYSVAAAGGPVTPVFAGGAGVAWLAGGEAVLVTVRGQAPHFARLAMKDGKPSGKPQPAGAAAGVFPLASPEGKWIYYARGTNNSSLWRVPAGGGEPVRVVDAVENNGSWTVTREGVWFLALAASSGATTVELLDPETGKRHTVAAVARRPMWGLAVCPGAECVIHTQADRFESDLMMVEGFR